MKKLILMLFIFSAVFGFSCRVGFCATPDIEDLTPNVKDGNYITGGTYAYKYKYNSSSWSVVTISNAKCIYGYVTRDHGGYGVNVYNVAGESDQNHQPTYTEVETLTDGSVYNAQGTFSTWSGTVYTSEGGYFVANFPIFDDVDDVNNYIAGNGYDNAVNIGDVDPQPSLSDTVPAPSKITLTNQSLQQNQNIFINDIEFTVSSGDLSSFSGDFDCQYYVKLNLIRHQDILGVTRDTILEEGTNDHMSQLYVTQGAVTYNDNGTCTVKVSASELNNFVAKIYSDNNITAGSGSSSIFSQIYLNQLTISARNHYIEGTEFVVGSWSKTYNFTYNYFTKTASGYDSSVPNDNTDGTEKPNVTPNDNTGNGYGSNNGSNEFTGTITNDYPKWDLYHKLTNLFSNDNQIKQSVDSGFNNISDNLSFTSLLATVMPFMGSDYWDLIRLAMTMGVGVTGVRCVYKFLRG